MSSTITAQRNGGFRAITRLSLRNIIAHKLRLLLTVLAVVLGTAFIAGSLMFTASLSKTFDSIVDGEMKNVDAVLSVSSNHGDPEDAASPLAGEGEPSGLESGASDASAMAVQGLGAQALDSATLGKIRDLPAVGAVNVADQVQAVAAKPDGTTIDAAPAPTMIQPFYDGDKSVKGATPVVEGNAPSGEGEAVLNESAAEAQGVHVGDKLKIVTAEGNGEVKISGLYSAELEVGGFIGISMDPEAFLNKYVSGNQPRTLYISAAPGTSAEDLVAALKQEFPQYSTQTGVHLSEEISKEISKALSFVSYFLVAFGLVGLLVGTFIIANTFSMIVAQRMREFALLRAIGVSRAQLTGSVVLEALFVGVLGSGLGVVAGMGLVQAIYAVLDQMGAGLPSGGITLTTTAVVVPLIVGTIVTVLSAWAPARAAGAARPVEAMRSGDASSSSSLKLRTIIGVVVFLIGAVLAALGAFQDGWATKTRAISVGVAALLVVLGTFLGSPAFARVAVPAIGRVVGAPFGAVGVLARKNSARNPRRTATTAFALTLGLALVAVVGTLGATMKASVAEVAESTITADYVASGPHNSGFPVPNAAVKAINETPGVASTAVLGSSMVNIDGHGAIPGQPVGFYFDGDPNQVVDFTTVEGSTTLEKPGFIADTKTAAAHGWSVGQTYPVNYGKQATGEKLPLLGIYEPNQVLGSYALSRASVDEVQPQSGGAEKWPGQVMVVLISGTEPTSTDELHQALLDSTQDYLVVQVLTPQEFAGESAVMVDQMLNILYALLALAIIVAVLGIINTLALNVIERRQEIGMLRAIGTMRGQVRRMITLEAVQIAVYGALQGVVIGLGLGWAFVTVLAGEGLETVSVPWSQLGIMILGSAMVGVVAAAWPAVKAGRTPPLEAIAD